MYRLNKKEALLSSDISLVVVTTTPSGAYGVLVVGGGVCFPRDFLDFVDATPGVGENSKVVPTLFLVDACLESVFGVTNLFFFFLSEVDVFSRNFCLLDAGNKSLHFEVKEEVPSTIDGKGEGVMRDIPCPEKEEFVTLGVHWTVALLEEEMFDLEDDDVAVLEDDLLDDNNFSSHSLSTTFATI